MNGLPAAVLDRPSHCVIMRADGGIRVEVHPPVFKRYTKRFETLDGARGYAALLMRAFPGMTVDDLRARN